MRKNATVLLLVAFLSLGACAAGCAESDAGDSDAAEQNSVDAPAGEAAPPADGQTLWTVADTDDHLPDDDPDVQAVRTLVTVHSGTVDNRGPENLVASLDEEFALYAPDFADQLDGVAWREKSAERVVENDVVTEQVGLGWMQSTIDDDRVTATARYESHLVFTEGDAAFLAQNGIEIGAEYVMLREVTTTAIDGEWFISDVRESGLQPRTAAE